MQRISMFILIMLLWAKAIAQQEHVIDSLQNEIKKFDAHKLEKGKAYNAQEDTTRIDLLYQLCIQYVATDAEKVKQIASEIIQSSELINYKDGLADGYTVMGIYYNHKGDFRKCIEMHQQALDIANQLKDDIRITRSYNELGLVYSNLGNYSKALEYYLVVLKKGEARHDTDLCVIAYDNIGIVYLSLNDYSQSLSYLKKELALIQNSNDVSGIAGCYINMGLAYSGLKNNTAALEYYFNGLELCKQSGNKYYEANDYSNIGAVYVDKEAFDTALVYFDKSIKLFNEVGAESAYIGTMQSSAEAWFGKKEYQQSLNCLNKVVDKAKSMGALEQLTCIYQTYSKTYEALNDFKNAFKYHVLYKQTNDSLINTDKLNNINQLQLQYELNKQQLEDSIKMEQANYNSQLKVQKQKSYAVAGILIVAALSVIGLIYFRNRKKLEQQRALMEERSRISRELHDDVGSTLSSIRMMSEIAKIKLGNQSSDAKQTLERISDNTHEMQDKMGDLVWALSSYNEGMDKVIVRIRKYAGEITDAKNVELIFENDDFSKSILPVIVRQNVYLIAKEAINNAMKYSLCSTLKIKIKTEDRKLVVTVEDNGKGFDNSIEQEGNGMRTMKKRADEIKGELKIISEIGRGTKVSLILITT